METQEQQPTPEVHLADDAETLVTASHDSGVGDESAAVHDDDAVAEDIIEALQAEATAQQQKAEEYRDSLQRLQADFQNYRRRVTQEKLQAATRGKEDVLRALLPVVTNFGLALQHVEQDAHAVRQGVQMIWQQLEGFLRDQGMERIPTVGQVFDPAYHEVLSTAPATAETPANTIVSEIKAGYCFEGRLLSPAQVVVAKAADAPLAEAPSVA